MEKNSDHGSRISSSSPSSIADLARTSTASLPGMPEWPGIHARKLVEKTFNKNLSERNCKLKRGVGFLASARTKLLGEELRRPKARRRALRWMISSFLKREFCIIGITIAPYSIELRIAALKIVIREEWSAPHHGERRHLIILISFLHLENMFFVWGSHVRCSSSVSPRNLASLTG